MVKFFLFGNKDNEMKAMSQKYNFMTFNNLISAIMD